MNQDSKTWTRVTVLVKQTCDWKVLGRGRVGFRYRRMYSVCHPWQSLHKFSNRIAPYSERTKVLSSPLNPQLSRRPAIKRTLICRYRYSHIAYECRCEYRALPSDGCSLILSSSSFISSSPSLHLLPLLSKESSFNFQWIFNLRIERFTSILLMLVPQLHERLCVIHILSL